MRLSGTEWKIMNVLWDKSPATAREVLERLEADTEWAYTTVKTMLTRLEEKQAVRSRMRANTAVYEPIVTRNSARRSALRTVIDSAFDGAFGSMLHFLVTEEKLTKKQREELLRQLGSEKGKGKN